MKPKIIIDREPIRSEEILARRNFSQLVSDVKLMQKPFFKSTWFISSVAATALVSIALLTYFNTPSPQEEQPDSPTPGTNAVLAEKPTENIPQYAEDSPCIKAPVKGAEKPATIYTINNGQGAHISTSNGTEIHIPQNTLADEGGKILQGNVDIHLREFHTLGEIILSGIPMQYDSAGTTYHFESAGMIDISATQDGRSVHIAPGKQIEVKMASTSADGKFNHYQLDTLQKNWVYLGKEKVEKIKSNQKSINTTDPVLPKQEIALLVQKDPAVIQKTRQTEQQKQLLASMEKSKPLEPKKVNPANYNFNIDVDPREFPEMSSFSGTRFEVGPENKNFNAKWYDKNWTDLKLSENNAGVNYKLDLTSIENGQAKVSSLIVYPVFQGADYEKARQLYNEKLQNYTERIEKSKQELTKKEQELKNLVAQKEKELSKERQQQLDRQRLQQQQRENELALQKSEDRGSSEGVLSIRGNSKASVAKMTAMRSFSINKFGIYNSDCGQQVPTEKVISALFIDGETETPLIPADAFLVDLSKNCTYVYTQQHFSRFGFDPEANNVLLVFLNDGKAACFSSEDFRRAQFTDRYTFRMRITEKAIRDEKDIRDLLNT